MAFLLSSSCDAIIVAILAVAIFVFRLRKNPASPKHIKNSPPEAAGGWPVLGHLHILTSSGQHPHITLGALADKYGPIFRIRIGIQPALIISSWELAKECFTTNDIAMSSRPDQIGAKHLGYNKAMFGFSPYGPFWREMRKILALELFSNRRLELLKHVRASEVESSIKDLFNFWRSKQDALLGGRLVVEMKQWFGDLNLNVILRMVAGKRYFGGVVGCDQKEARECQDAMRELFHLLGQFLVGDAIPFLRWLDVGGYERAMRRVGKQLDDMGNKWLQEHRRKRTFGEGKEEQDFMDVMMSILEGSNLSGFEADTVNKATCLNLVSGGADTVTVTITWALALLLNNPHAMRKAQEELDTQIGKGRLVNESDISNLVYLRAIVKEALRLYALGPLGGSRETTEDCTIGGYHVPAGTRVIVNLWKIHMDPRVWSDPSAFKPERFLTTHKDVEVKGHSFELIPFGSGRRICPGVSFGLQMIHLVLASLLHAFEVSTPSDEPVDMSSNFGLTHAKATPLDVLVKPRLPLNVYE